MSHEIEHRHLRSAIEFAVLIVSEGQKRRPPLPFPTEFKAFLSAPRLPATALGRLRRVMESDPTFRAAICAGALPELVDEVGRLWLANRPGWEAEAATLIESANNEAASTDLRRDLRRSEKRRAAAEQATARGQLELLRQMSDLDAHRRELEELRTDLIKADDAVSELRSELIDTRNEIRHARDREAAAVRRAEAAETARAATHTMVPDPATAGISPPRESTSNDDVGSGRVDPTIEVDQVTFDALLNAAQGLADQLASLQRAESHGRRSEAHRPRIVRSKRVPLLLPGGIIATSGAAAAHLVRSGAVVLVDGYNVAKLAWPERSLEQQRDALIDRVENLARRLDVEATVIFDGASIVGAHAGGARRVVRVLYSPAGVSADDVIRDEVDRLPSDRAVIVVTNDREIVRDVRAAGANVVPSNAFLAIL